MKALLLPLLLIGCATTTLKPPTIIEVKVPVIISCIKKLPLKPQFKKDAELVAMGNAEFVTALHIDRLLRDAYIAELEAVVEGCK